MQNYRFHKILGVVEIRNKVIPKYYTNNPNENKMIGLFELCHT